MFDWGPELMKRYQPLVLQELDLAVPTVRIHRLALHRHMPGTTSVRPHAHRLAQCLVYLTGQGSQRIGSRTIPVQAGTAIFLPPHTEHAFRRERNRRPICLVLDLEWRGSGRRTPIAARLPVAVFREVQQLIATVVHLQRLEQTGPPLQLSAAILKLLDRLLSGLGLTHWVAHEPPSPVSSRVERLLESPDSMQLPLGKVAQAVGYQRDYLNRILKQQTGLTLGQVRARRLAARSRKVLQQAGSVTEAANALGFADANYFARWFRKQTGLTPSQWRLSVPGPAGSP